MSEALSVLNSDKMRLELAKICESKAMIDRAIRLGTSALNNPDPKNKLPLCSGSSFASSFIKSIQLNLEPNTVLGQCYLIPRQIKGKWEATFELGYKGLIELAYRSGEIKLIQAYTVYANDTFDVDYGENKLIHKPILRGEKGPEIAYWARYTLKDGTSDFSVWTVEQIEKHRDQYSKGANSDYSPWVTAFDKMAKKTVIKDVLSYAAMSIQDLRKTLAEDGTVIDLEKDEFKDVKTKPSMLEIVSKPVESAEPEEKLEIDIEEEQRQAVVNSIEVMIKKRKDEGAVEAEIENTIGYKLHEVEAQSMKTLLEIAKSLK